MVAWWSCVEGEMRSSKIDSVEEGSVEAGVEVEAEPEPEVVSRGADSGAGESGGRTASAMRR
jgi:hypothetical protein